MDAEILYDFRSDTVTRPTAAMLQAMLKAPTGDDVFGDDPTVLALESETAALLGKEAALFVASGTMSNLLAMRLHVGPLAEVLCDHRAHVHQWEVGGIHATGAAVAAVAPEPGERFLTAASVAAHTRTDNCLYHQPVTAVLALENTLNGDVMPLAEVDAAAAEARALGLATHLDGARLWNAVAASEGVAADAWAAPFDTVSVCLSKGLGAPIGSVLVGSAAHIDRARHFRKLSGGGWRQAGLLAAAGRHALAHHRERLAEDHAAAEELAAGVADLGFAVQPPETNMVVRAAGGGRRLRARGAAAARRGGHPRRRRVRRSARAQPGGGGGARDALRDAPADAAAGSARLSAGSRGCCDESSCGGFYFVHLGKPEKSVYGEVVRCTFVLDEG